jgi:Replication-relaxation
VRKGSEDAALLAVSAHLTKRDRMLVRLVGVLRVLTTDQLAALGFGSITTARHRLSVLVRLGLLRRFRPHPETGSASWHYLLGLVGTALLGAEDRDEKRWVPQVRADQQLALERSARLAHMTGRNWFFVALARQAREGGGELREWLNEPIPLSGVTARRSGSMTGVGCRTRRGGHPGRGRPGSVVPAGV